MRYGQWLSKNNLLEDAKNAYTRAATTFLPHNNTRVTIALALIQEEEGDIDGARQTYTSLLEKGNIYFCERNIVTEFLFK